MEQEPCDAHNEVRVLVFRERPFDGAWANTSGYAVVQWYRVDEGKRPTIAPGCLDTDPLSNDDKALLIELDLASPNYRHMAAGDPKELLNLGHALQGMTVQPFSVNWLSLRDHLTCKCGVLETVLPDLRWAGIMHAIREHEGQREDGKAAEKRRETLDSVELQVLFILGDADSLMTNAEIMTAWPNSAAQGRAARLPAEPTIKKAVRRLIDVGYAERLRERKGTTITQRGKDYLQPNP